MGIRSPARDRTTWRRCSTGSSSPCGPARIDVALPFAALRLHATRLVHEFKRGDHQCDTCLQSCRSEEHTSELQSLMRISYAVFCLKKKNQITINTHKKTNNNKNIKTI